jgi:hypothetical protein
LSFQCYAGAVSLRSAGIFFLRFPCFYYIMSRTVCPLLAQDYGYWIMSIYVSIISIRFYSTH